MEWSNLGKDVEVVDVFTFTQGFVKLDRGIIADVSLDEDNVSSKVASYLAKFVYQARSDALTAIFFEDRQIIYVDLGAFLLELFEDICGESADYFIPCECDECDEIISSLRAS